jgi:DNA mismatch endonuclease Vsr
MHSPSRSKFADVTPGRRRNMQANTSKNTKPEMTIRRILHGIGYRYRLHAKGLPGKPDIVFTARCKIVEIRGCFWHGHGCFPLGQLPKARTEYWSSKIAGNQARDARNMALLRALGWEVLELWECRVRAAPKDLVGELVAFLGPISVQGRTLKNALQGGHGPVGSVHRQGP